MFADLSRAALSALQNKKEIAYFVYAALPSDGYESLITALGFTGIPFPDLRADIRIANLLVCPERVGWGVGGGGGRVWWGVRGREKGNRSLICPDNLEPQRRPNQALFITVI